MRLTTTHQQNTALDALVSLQRTDARSFAAQCRAMVELDRLSDLEAASSGVRQFLVLEVAGSCRLGQQAAGTRLLDAGRVVHGLPRMLTALEDGEFFVPQARIVLAETDACSLDLLRRVDAEVMPQALDLASTDLRRLVRRTVLAMENADEAAERLESARASRRVTTRPGIDGMGVVNALLTAEQLARFQVGLNRLVAAERVADREAGIERTQDQRRADVLAALPDMALVGGFEAGASLRPQGGVVFNVHIPVTTVLERGSEPGFVDGYGEISAEHVRLLRPDAALRPIYVDDVTGQPVHIGDTVVPPAPDPSRDPAADLAAARDRVIALLRPVVHRDGVEDRHDPSAALGRLVDARDRWCTGPGCSSTRCHRDHLTPYPEGLTSVGNLGLKSERCHAAKHNGWTMVRHPDGSVTWTSPLGRTYRRPSPHVPPPRVGPLHTPSRPAGRREEPHDDPEPPPVPPPPLQSFQPPSASPLTELPDDPPF